ncbi:MAG: hypothetical protein A2X86_20890 [Bdellovibrionales bacterium GWA2_49_15]|nr:MAG: hypothetical protein A2X86_20890 [Bdellovibrionales bacterium GWA2_49_15]
MTAHACRGPHELMIKGRNLLPITRRSVARGTISIQHSNDDGINLVSKRSLDLMTPHTALRGG